MNTKTPENALVTLDEIKDALPRNLRLNATQELTDKVNKVAKDPEYAKIIRENFLSYTSVLEEGKFKVEDYLHAVAYVSYKLMGYTNQEAYARTFPDRYRGLRAKNVSDKDISSYVASYNKGKLVNMLLEQTLIPSWVLNQDIYQQAIETQAELMVNAKSEKVRTDAANSILTHLKKPEKKQVELSIGPKENSGTLELKNLLTELAERQKQMISTGTRTKEIAHQPLMKGPPQGEIIEAEAVEIPLESRDQTDERENKRADSARGNVLGTGSQRKYEPDRDR